MAGTVEAVLAVSKRLVPGSAATATRHISESKLQLQASELQKGNSNEV